MAKGKVRLSQCMIVKNEEANMEQALSWGKGIVCEQIVVDTGSTDRTVELAKQMGAKVFSFTWNDNFSAAKNYAIKQAKGNWIAFLDADEWFPKEDAEKLLPLLEEVHPDPEIDFVRSKLVCLDEDGSVMGAFCQERIFRNHPKLRYRYRIHEELHRSDKTMGMYDVQEELMILHSGYGGEDTGKEKGARNARLLQQDVKENPTDGMRAVYLGDAYDAAGRTNEALDCYRKVLWDPAMEMTHRIAPVRAGLQIMSLRVNESAAEIQEEYVKVRDKLLELGWECHPDIDYYLGCWHLKAGKADEAAVLFERALAKLETYHGEDVVRMTSNLEFPNRVIATAALIEGNAQKAVSFIVSALKLHKYSPDGIQILLKAFLTEWKEGMPVEPYWQFLCKLYDTANLKDLLFLYKFAGEAGFETLQQRIREWLPAEVQEQVQRNDPA